MKKKVLYGVAVALFASVAMGSLQSCKDDVTDLKQQVVFDRNELTGKLNALQEQLNACKQNCETEIAALKVRIANNEGNIAQLNADLQALQQEVAKKASVDDLNNAINALRTEVNGYTDQQIANLKANEIAAINTEIASINTKIDGLNTRLGEAETKISTLETKVGNLETGLGETNTKVSELEGSIGELQGKLEQDEAVIAAIQSELQDLVDANDANSKEISKLVDKYVALQQQVDGLKDYFDSEIEGVWLKCFEIEEELTQVYNALMAEIDAINLKLDRVESAINALAGFQQKLVTGIIVQGTENPVFGNFSLPLGIQSNLLFSWYGSLRDVTFPSGAAADQADGVSVTLPAGAKTVTINPDEAEFNLGKLFMTINPVGTDFDNTKLTLETSAGNKFVKDLEIEPSDYELYFGYTRSEENGFYEAPVVLNAEEAKEAAIEIDEDLKSTMKNFVKDPSKRGAVSLLRGVYEQLNGKLAAYAVRYDWTVDAVETPFILDSEEEVYQPKDYSVFSKYEVAAATAKALSYKFLDGYGTSKRLPEFGSIDNFIEKLKDNPNLHFSLGEPIKFDNVTLDLGDIDFGISGDNIRVNLPHATVDLGDDNGPTDVVFDQDFVVVDMQTLYSNINEQIKKAFEEQVTPNLNEQINTQLLAEINTKLANMYTNLEEEINGKINTLIDKASNKLEPLFKRVNQVINLYNKVAGKINNFLADPNAYLQVAAFYEYNDGVGIVSGKQNDPTVFTKDGGNAINIYLSSYTGEIIVPAYKKYIGCVTDPKIINEVLEGNEYKVSIDADKLTAGTTYEFVYQGLDYSGYISTKKFYITVK